MPKRPLPDGERREQKRFERLASGVVLGLVVLAALLVLVLYLIG